MPELPEVETTRRGISSHLLNQKISAIEIRQRKLKVPVTSNLETTCSGQVIQNISRRAKYLLFDLGVGHIMVHLGMSGHLRLVTPDISAGKHDHIDLRCANGTILRYHDPRRFGLWLYITGNPLAHALLAHLGPEPLSKEFNGDYLYQRMRNKTRNIKSMIMDNTVVVGVGNIYATESLFESRIHPLAPAAALSQEQCHILVEQIKIVLQSALNVGGTTLKDFFHSEGKPGYFGNMLKVYGRTGGSCIACKTTIESVKITGRTSSFCPNCQSTCPSKYNFQVSD